MAISQYSEILKFNEVKSLLQTDDDLTNAVAILVLKAKHNVIVGNRPFQININDLKNFFPIVYRNEYSSRYRYKLHAKSNDLDGSIILRYNLQNDYEYVQITFDGAIQDFKTSLVIDAYFAIVKFKNTDVMKIYHTTSDEELLTLSVVELATDTTVYEPPAIAQPIKANNTIYFGSPGTGKSNTVDALTSGSNVRKITFHPEYDYHSFVGGYKPSMDGTDIVYKFVPQIFTKIYIEAWQNPTEPYYLQIEEINRGNCAEIFGDLFQLLDRDSDGSSKYDVDASEELLAYLTEELGEGHDGIVNEKIKLPKNLSIIATMNTSDQSLFPMDSAFKRRWDWEYMKIDYDCTKSDFVIKLNNKNTYEWLKFLKAVNRKIFETTGSPDKQIGNWFINATDTNKIIDEKTFINKVLFYLWNDVFKDEDESLFDIDGETRTHEDFFTQNENSTLIVKMINEHLGLTNNTAEQETVETENGNTE